MIQINILEYTELQCVEFRLDKPRILKRDITTYLAENIPTQTGVYFLVDDQGKMEYIGSTLNFKNRLGQHLWGGRIKSRKAYLLPTKNLVEAQMLETIYICHYKPYKNQFPNIRNRHNGRTRLERKVLDDPDYEQTEEELEQLKMVIEHMWE